MASRGRRRGFTVLELLVVVGIIILMMALAVPAVSKFLEGQKLSQSGRILQSAFNEARRAAITQRERNYLVFFTTTDAQGRTVFGVRRYREEYGYEGDARFLLPNVEIDLAEDSSPPPPDPRPSDGEPAQAGRIRGMFLPVYNGRPPEDSAIFTADKTPEMRGDTGWLEFQPDGTVQYESGPGAVQDTPPPSDGAAADLFDLNIPIDELPDDDADRVDMSLIQNGQLDRRCFLDLDPNTGRLRFRVTRCFAPQGT